VAKKKAAKAAPAPVPKAALKFKRGVVDTLPTCVRKTWLSICGKYKVEEHAKRVGGLPNLYYALALPGDATQVFAIIGTHRKRSIAEETCRQHYRKGG
jgi:hypothetical protein